MTEQEAREQVMLAIANGFENVGLTARVVSLESTALDAYRASVRAETLREVRGVIADVKAGGEDFADNADEKFGWDQACDCVHNSLALKDTLDALAHPEGTA